MENRAKITFANNEELILKEGDLLIPILKHDSDEKDIFTAKHDVYEVWNHIGDGLIPSLTELICRCDFFRLLDNEKVYKTTAVVSIQNI